MVTSDHARFIQEVTIKEEDDNLGQELQLLDKDPMLLNSLMQDLNIDSTVLAVTASPIPPSITTNLSHVAPAPVLLSLSTNIPPITLKRKLLASNGTTEMNDQLLLMPATIKPHSSIAKNSTKEIRLDTQVSKLKSCG